MNTTFVKHNFVYAVIAGVVIACLFWLLPERKVEPHGIFLPTKEANVLMRTEASPVLLSEMPIYGKILGHMSIMMLLPASPTEKMNQSNLERCIEMAHALAKKVGASGIVILRSAHFNKDSGSHVTFLYAQAVQ